MMETLRQMFGTDLFMPHGHCYLWQPALLWLQVSTNALIGLAYLAIAATLAYLVRRGDYVPFKGMALAFGVFIVTCGITHFMDVYVIWEPAYWLDGMVRALTAVASVGTAILLPRLVPEAIALSRGAKAARERGIELQTAVEDLGRLYEKARELDQIKTQFFANVSHELRTPLALILGPSEKLLAADNLTDDQRRDLEVVRRNAHTVLKHVNDLLDVARMEGGRLEPTYSRLDVGALVRLTAAHFDALAAERAVELVVDAPQNLTAEVDPDKLQRIVLNLLSNAFKFTPAPGKVHCRVAALPSSHSFLVEVADSGPGIPPEQRRQVFERFIQGDASATRRFGGTGLGLTIARDFVELHGGSIEIADAPAGGALFRVTMPMQAPAGIAVDTGWSYDAEAYDDQSNQAVNELRQRVEAFEAGTERNAGRVLVVEDHPEMNRFVREALEDAGFETDGAPNGKRGLEQALRAPPDLIVTDVMMPEMSGDELVRAARQEPSLQAVPIMLLTAKADEELRIRMLREGAQDYLMKPFSADELRARTRNLVTMKRAQDVLQRELDLQIQDLELLAREVTDRKRELQSTLESMRIAREHAERASAVKTNFLRLISHELRTPLASLLLQMERLRLDRDGGLSEDKRALVERMSGSTRRLHDLIEGLLQYTRTKAGRVNPSVTAVDTRALAEDLLEAARSDAADKGLELRLQPGTPVPPLQSDGNMVRLIPSNLLQNAIRYTVSGSVTISLHHVGGAHRLAVSDTGPGIAPEDQMRIFEPFEQGQPVRRKHAPGVGLGLALVKEIADALGGRIELESAPGQGSTFTLVVPDAATSH